MNTAWRKTLEMSKIPDHQTGFLHTPNRTVMTVHALQQSVLDRIVLFRAHEKFHLEALLRMVSEMAFYRQHKAVLDGHRRPQLRAVVELAISDAVDQALLTRRKQDDEFFYVRTTKAMGKKDSTAVMERPAAPGPQVAEQKSAPSDAELREARYEAALAKMSPKDRERARSIRAMVEDERNFVLRPEDYEKMIRRNADPSSGVEASDLDMDE